MSSRQYTTGFSAAAKKERTLQRPLLGESASVGELLMNGQESAAGKDRADEKGREVGHDTDADGGIEATVQRGAVDRISTRTSNGNGRQST